MILPLIIEPSKEIMDFFDKNGSKVQTNSSLYYFLPYWIEERKDGVHFIHLLNNLPKDLLESVKSMRGMPEDVTTYTASDMIEFAKGFLRGCQRSKVTPYQLEIFNKGKKNG